LQDSQDNHGEKLVRLAGAMLAAMQAGESDRLCRLIADRAEVIAAVQEAGGELGIDPAGAEMICRADEAATSFLKTRINQVKDEIAAIRGWRAALPGYRAGHTQQPRFVDRRG
jgi:hypothetical protein